MEMKKGFYFSFDAFMALTVISAALLVVVQASDTATNPVKPNQISYRQSVSTGQDAMKLASYHQVNYLNDSFEQELLDKTVMEESDLNRTMLDGITLLWAAENFTYAEEAAERYLDKVVPEGYNYSLQVTESGKTTAIYNTSDGWEDAEAVSSISRMVSGHSLGRESEGVQAGATLGAVDRDAVETRYFGGYVGDGDISFPMNLSGVRNVTNVTIEGDFSGPFNLEFNSVDAGDYYPGGGNLSADTFHVCGENYHSSRCDALGSGRNLVNVNFLTDNKSIEGGFLRIKYEKEENITAYTADYRVKRKYIPGIDGVINYYGSFYVPGQVQTAEARIHYDSVNQTIFLRAGNATLYENETTGETTIKLDDSDIRGNLSKNGISYDDISQETVPLRLGLRDIDWDGESANADTMAIIDTSGSMDCWWGTCPIDEAKKASKEFVNVVLNTTGNRAGVIGYAGEIKSFHELTTDNKSLHNTIESMSAGGGTCIACGIMRGARQVAYNKDIDTLVERGSTWEYNNSYLNESLPDNESSWNKLNHSIDWNRNETPLGNSSGVETEIQSNGTVYYREEFSGKYRQYKDALIHLRSEDPVTVFLNNETVYNGTEEMDGEYWDRTIAEGGVYDLEDTTSERADASRYCHAEATDTVLPLSKVELDGISHISGDNGGYLNATSDITDPLIPGREYTMTIEKDYTYPGFSAAVFDWDDDGAIQDNEMVDLGYCRGRGCRVSENIKVPEKAENSTVLMRVFTVYAPRKDYLSPCHDPKYGEIEDYSVQVAANLSASPELDVGRTDNILAAKVRNNDSSSDFDMELEATEKRNDSIVVMSDGVPNREMGLQNVPDHNGDGSVDEKDETIEAACRAAEMNVTVYTVAFGNDADEETLNLTAKCGDGEYYESDVGELKQIFGNISTQIVETSLIGQTVRTSGDDEVFGEVYRDSYIEFNYTENLNWGFGRFPVTATSERFGGDVESPKNGSFKIPEEAEPLSARLLSYSGNRWTDRVYVEQGSYKPVYRLWEYNTRYREMGDPFRVRIPKTRLSSGENNVSVDTAFSRTEPRGGSPDNRVVYRFLVDGSVGFGKVYPNETKAQEDAINRLNNSLDYLRDSDFGDVSFESEDLKMDTRELGDQPRLWGPATVKLVVWE